MKALLRIMFVLVLGLGLLATTQNTTTAVAAETIQLKMVVFNIAEAKPVHAIKTYCDKIKARSGGRVEIKILGGGEIFAPPDQLAKCKEGLVDMVFCPAGYWARMVPEFAFDGLPYDVDWDGLPALMDAVRPLVNAVYAKHRVIQLGNYYMPGPFQFMTKEPVRSMADLKGRSIRGHGIMPGILIEALGASAVTLPSTEVVGALERGVVGGAMLAPGTCQDLKIWDLGVKYGVKYELAFAFGCNAIINQAAYNRLPADLQKTLLDVGIEHEREMVKYFEEDEAKVLADLKAHGVTFYTLPPDEAKRWREATVAKAGPAFLEIKGVDKGIAQKFVDLMGKKW